MLSKVAFAERLRADSRARDAKHFGVWFELAHGRPVAEVWPGVASSIVFRIYEAQFRLHVLAGGCSVVFGFDDVMPVLCRGGEPAVNTPDAGS